MKGQIYKGCELSVFQREETVEENERKKVEPLFVQMFWREN